MGRFCSLLKSTSLRAFIASLALSISILPVAQATVTVTYFHNDVSGSPLLETDASGAVVWQSGTYGSGANRLTMQPDGNLVVYRDSLNPNGTHTRTPLWATYTVGR